MVLSAKEKKESHRVSCAKYYEKFVLSSSLEYCIDLTLCYRNKEALRRGSKLRMRKRRAQMHQLRSSKSPSPKPTRDHSPSPAPQTEIAPASQQVDLNRKPRRQSSSMALYDGRTLAEHR